MITFSATAAIISSAGALNSVSYTHLKIRAIAEKLGYAAKPKDYKKNPEIYKGHVGDVSTVIRIALMGRAQSPDVWEIQQILGEERTRARIKQFMS